MFLLIRNEDGSYTKELYEGDVIWGRLLKYLDNHAAPEPIELEHPEVFEPPVEESTGGRRRRRDDKDKHHD